MGTAFGFEANNKTCTPLKSNTSTVDDEPIFSKEKEINSFEFIESVAEKHRKHKLVKFELTNEEKNKIISYADANQRQVNDMLHKIGYTFVTCINYSPFDEVMSLIKGEPYFYYVINEVDPSMKEIKVDYYEFLLRPIVKTKMFFSGTEYDIEFITAEKKINILNDKIDFKLQLGRGSSSNEYNQLSFIAVDKD